MWRGASAYFKGHVEAKCILWAKQAGRGIPSNMDKGVVQSSLESNGSPKGFRDCGKMWISEKQSVTVGGLEQF